MFVPGDNPATPPPNPAPIPRLHGKAAWDEASTLAHRWSKAILRSKYHHLAEDVAQEALAIAHRKAEAIRGDWKPWLHTVVRRLSLRRVKEERRRTSRDSEGAEALPSETDCPGYSLLEKDTREGFMRCLDQVDSQFGEHTRVIIELHTGGIPWQKITAITKLADSTCRTRFRIAKRWICDRLSLQPARRGQHD